MKYNDWEAFWLKRGKMKFEDLKPFLHNFYVFQEILTKHFGADLQGLNCLEVGAGRGTFSHYLKNWDVNCKAMDIKNHMLYSHIPFIEGDVFNMPFDKPLFDIVFTYGLIEHFKPEKQVDALSNMLDITVNGGLNVHYIVPLKLTNITEDRSVYRDQCYILRKNFDLIWTYPIMNMGSWRTNKWYGKGAFFSLEKKDENLRTCDSEIE